MLLGRSTVRPVERKFLSICFEHSDAFFQCLFGYLRGWTEAAQRDISGKMRKQATLFSDLERRPNTAVPKGFQYRENLITEVEESSLASAPGELSLKPFELHGHRGNRRVASIGFRYDYSRAVVEYGGGTTGLCESAFVRVAKFALQQSEEFRQVGANECSPGLEPAGIGTNHSSESLRKSHL
jgi:hypothetical protein